VNSPSVIAESKAKRYPRKEWFLIMSTKHTDMERKKKKKGPSLVAKK
jgi:hypothetical protein